MSRIVLVKIHPGLNMALPQLSGDLTRAGHKTRLIFFKDYKFEREYLNSEFSVKARENGQDQIMEEYSQEYHTLAEKL